MQFESLSGCRLQFKQYKSANKCEDIHSFIRDYVGGPQSMTELSNVCHTVMTPVCARSSLGVLVAAL